MMTPSLFDLPPEVVSAAIAPHERQRLNAAAVRVLSHLQSRGWVTNAELCDPAIGGLRAVGRVWELQRHGYTVAKEHVSGGTWRYRLVQSHD